MPHAWASPCGISPDVENNTLSDAAAGSAGQKTVATCIVLAPSGASVTWLGAQFTFAMVPFGPSGVSSVAHAESDHMTSLLSPWTSLETWRMTCILRIP